jgi:protein required for attachment to host cells
MKGHTTWILVADGARARIYQNQGLGLGLTETRFLEMVGMHEPTRSINADREGRMGQGAMVHSADPHREQKRVFARDIAEFLDDQAQANAFDRLVLVAPPKALGDLREKLNGAVSTKIVGEMAKDLTHVEMRELPKHLESVLVL